jgi:hypothetical protein
MLQLEVTHMADPTPSRRSTGRSPSFPAINLETAIRRARELYDRERQRPTAVTIIVRHWGYKSMSGPASLSLAALKKFGLLADEGRGEERRGRLTDLAVDIVENPDAAKRISATKLAALLPSMHRELWEKYRDSLPTDANLRWELVRHRGFTEGGAEDLIREYKQTVAFAELTADDREAFEGTEPEGDEVVVAADEPTPRQKFEHPAGPAAKRFDIPIFNGKTVAIEGEFPLSEEDWDQFMAVLGIYKPTLVARPPQS